MISGQVDGYQAILPLLITLRDGTREPVLFTVDTGFSGYLTLPIARIAGLGLPRSRSVAVVLADDTIVDVDVYDALIEWDGHVVEAEVLATGARPLLGTRMLAGHELLIEFLEQGRVSVRAIG